jgi:hypothetical protein
MIDLVFESIRAAVLLYLLIYLVRSAKERTELSRRGWRLITAGFGLLLLSMDTENDG